MEERSSYLKDAQSLVRESKKQYYQSRTRMLRTLRKIKFSRKLVDDRPLLAH